MKPYLITFQQFASVSLLVMAFSAVVAWGGEKPGPIQYRDIEEAQFTQSKFDKLSADQKAVFNRIYPPDQEMLERVRLGPINPQPMASCVVGEAPTIAEALKVFRAHYPVTGRMQNVTGIFEWEGKELFFRTERQVYQVKEYHILYRLEQMGLEQKSAPRKATLDAVWAVNKIHGLCFFYIQRAKLL